MLLADRLQELSTQNPYFSTSKISLKPLVHPVYIVTKNPKWQDLLDHPELIDNPEPIYERCVKTNDIWSVQAYLDLKLRGLNVHLVNSLIPGKICVVPYYFIKPKDLTYRSYIVACHHDCPHPKLCEQQIVINRSRVLDETHHFINHRPQPNLKPRDPSRGLQVRNVGFKGHDHSLYAPFRSPEFLAELEAIGAQLVTGTEGENAFQNWSDYTTTDVVLAVRNNTHFDISRKPALKLVNAWFAGCPAILGPEPAFQDLRRSELDYIEVRTPEEAIVALKRLQENPELYVAMVENGFKRAKEHTVDAIAQEWYNILSGPVMAGYEQWLRQSPLEKYVGRPLRYPLQVTQHKLADREYRRCIHEGSRIL